MECRRAFLKKIVAMYGLCLLNPTKGRAKPVGPERIQESQYIIYRALNGRPDENLRKVLEMMGGIETLVGSHDVVLIKPNVQWWNQGSSNFSALTAFVDLTMNRPGGFNGEVVIAENCHRGPTPWKALHSGWAHSFEWNSDVSGVDNMGELCGQLKQKYKDRFSTVHWIDVRAGGKRVFGPQDGNGYVYCDGTGGAPLLECENGAKGQSHRRTVMTYPIFETDRGTIVDFKNGIWEKGSYTSRALRFVNFAALNHHSIFCGATSTVKNYMGVTDLSGGSDPSRNGRLCGGYYNFHSFSFNGSAPGPVHGMLGKEVGLFMKTVRKADVNIVSAEWIGLSSRTDPPVAHTRLVMACKDPVALDYHGTKYVLHPNSRLSVHNPDDRIGPLRQYLDQCAKEGGGTLDERYVGVKSYDFATQLLQPDDALVVKGDIRWGTAFKPLVKYMLLRYCTRALRFLLYN